MSRDMTNQQGCGVRPFTLYNISKLASPDALAFSIITP
jgi:hypothetical protein